MYNKMENSSNVEMNDIKLFKNLTLVFMLCNIGALIFNFLHNDQAGSEITWFGLSIFIFGIYSLSKKYSTMKSGNKVSLLFIIILALNIGFTFINLYILKIPEIIFPLETDVYYFFQIPLSSSLLIIRLIAIGILTFYSAKYLTNWFNIEFGKFDKTILFYYYGIMYLIANTFLAFGVFVVSNRINAFWSLYDYGILFAFITAFTLIIASFQLFGILHSWVEGVYTTPQQPNHKQNSQESGLINSDLNDINTDSELNYCFNCGAKLRSSIKFCESCGIKL